MSDRVSCIDSEANKASVIGSDRSIEPLNDFEALDSEDYTPCVRYAFNDGQFSQAGKLTPVGEQPPEEAKFRSPMVYFISEDQSQRLYDGTPPKTIQRECQQDGRAFFKVVAESDALEDSVAGETVAEWLIEFAEDYAEAEEYQLYFSGNRSLHLHTDRWIQYEDLGKLKSLAESFNNETGGELDTSLYSSIPQFRLTGAEHSKTNLYKVPIQENFDRANLVRQAQIEPDSNTVQSSNGGLTHYVAGDADRSSLLTEIGNHLLWPHIKGGSEVDETWSGKPFSPYALTGSGDYSVCLMTYDHMTERNGQHYARGLVHEAVGGDNQYTRHDSYSEVLLSGHDVAKWNYDSGDTVVIIGGQSRNSRIMQVDTDEALLLDTELQENGRESALALLERFGYDTGNRGLHDFNRPEGHDSKAAELKSAIDTGRRSADYDSVFRVVCRLLKVEGWSTAMEWLQRTHGPQFDSEDSHDRLKGIVEYYSDSFEDVSVPPSGEQTDSGITEKEI
jgi:hypothetical protein